MKEMDDLISRQAMLDGIDKLIKIHFDRTVVLYKARKVAEDLPSVQPEIIRCKDCKHSRFFDPCFYCYEMGGEVIVPENGFCFKAERRMNATN